MSGWRPKTTKYGGLQNITNKPRKPVLLGTQFKNVVECLSGCFSYQDVVQGVKRQCQKKNYFVDGQDFYGDVPAYQLPLPFQHQRLKCCDNLKVLMSNLVDG